MSATHSLAPLVAVLVTSALGRQAHAQSAPPVVPTDAPSAAPSAPAVANEAPTELAPMPVRTRANVEIHFLAYRGEDDYFVDAGGQRCRTPCTIALLSGPTRIRASGTGDLNVQLVIPHLPAQVRLSHGAPAWHFPVGVTLIPTGIGVGASMWALGFACPRSGSACMIANFTAWPIVGVSMLIAGSVFAASANRAPPVDANRPEILDARLRRPGLRFTDFALGPTDTGVSSSLAFAY